MMKSYLIQILCLLARREELDSETKRGYTFRGSGKEYVVKQIQKYFEEHYREKISLNQIASNMYLSPVYISKIFKSETGETPINYLIGLRMEKAGKLLEENPCFPSRKWRMRSGMTTHIISVNCLRNITGYRRHITKVIKIITKKLCIMTDKST